MLPLPQAYHARWGPIRLAVCRVRSPCLLRVWLSNDAALSAPLFGHPTLIRYLQDLTEAATQQRLGLLSIGDLGQVRGGPTLSGHASHQTGLDVDIWFWLLPNGHPLPAAERETVSAPSMVMSDGRTLDSSQWSPQHAQLLRLAAGFEAVERIFVNPAIKQALCRQSPVRHGCANSAPGGGTTTIFTSAYAVPPGMLSVKCKSLYRLGMGVGLISPGGLPKRHASRRHGQGSKRLCRWRAMRFSGSRLPGAAPVSTALDTMAGRLMLPRFSLPTLACRSQTSEVPSRHGGRATHHNQPLRRKKTKRLVATTAMISKANG